MLRQEYILKPRRSVVNLLLAGLYCEHWKNSAEVITSLWMDQLAKGVCLCCMYYSKCCRCFPTLPHTWQKTACKACPLPLCDYSLRIYAEWSSFSESLQVIFRVKSSLLSSLYKNEGFKENNNQNVFKGLINEDVIYCNQRLAVRWYSVY